MATHHERRFPMIMSREEEVWSHFAACALSGLMASDQSPYKQKARDQVARAVEAADALMAEFHKRFTPVEKGPPPALSGGHE